MRRKLAMVEKPPKEVKSLSGNRPLERGLSLEHSQAAYRHQQETSSTSLQQQLSRIMGSFAFAIEQGQTKQLTDEQIESYLRKIQQTNRVTDQGNNRDLTDQILEKAQETWQQIGKEKAKLCLQSEYSEQYSILDQKQRELEQFVESMRSLGMQLHGDRQFIKDDTYLFLTETKKNIENAIETYKHLQTFSQSFSENEYIADLWKQLHVDSEISDIPQAQTARNPDNKEEVTIAPEYQWGDETKPGVYLQHKYNPNVQILVPFKGAQLDIIDALKEVQKLEPSELYETLQCIRDKRAKSIKNWNIKKRIELPRPQEQRIAPEYQWGDKTKPGVYLQHKRNPKIQILIPLKSKGSNFNLDLSGAFKEIKKFEPKEPYRNFLNITANRYKSIGSWNIIKRKDLPSLQQ